MKKSTLCSLFLAMVCTFLFAGASFAAVTGETTPASGLSPRGTQPGFEPVNLSDTRRDSLTVRVGRTINTEHSLRLGEPTGPRPGIFKVLAVLEHRVGDTRLLDKAKDKLAGMSDRRLRLAVSLSERADERNTSAEHDIAFLLLATLIILS